jgi:polyketide-type polyunsaturated fatty acid synthase PfaA
LATDKYVTMKKEKPANIAIIGMGCIFPKSCNLKEYWRLLFNGIDAIQKIPEETHWKLKDYFDKDPSKPDHTYCTRGGFLPKTSFDPLAYGIPPNNIEATDTSQLLGLEVARMALEDAGYPIHHPALQEKKVNVILGVTGTQELVIPLGARLGHPIWKKALKDSGIDQSKQEEILDRISGDYVQWQENSFPGLLGNVVAGRIANRLNLSGTNTVSDAACASSLSAIHTALMELGTGKCDMSITGGVDTLNDIFMHMCFSKTGVLSHSSDARPFSKDADGTVLGEGIGMLVLKRLEDAEQDNDKIYAVIKGLGTSSDGRTSAIYAPEAKGQIRALNDAYTEAGINPATVRLIEAHGTGTRVGDKVEFSALNECFSVSSKKNSTAIGSVKSMIGHTKAAAGAAGIIKTALALHHKTIPPTLKAIDPDPELKINDSAFYLNNQTKPWISSSPRRCGISAFGFGGSNFHAVLEEYTPGKDHVSWDGSVHILAFSDQKKHALKNKVERVLSKVKSAQDQCEQGLLTAYYAQQSRKSFARESTFRLLVVHQFQESIIDDLHQAIDCIEKETNHSHIYFSGRKSTGKIGFLFPGQGSQYTGMGKDLVSLFPEAMEAVNQASGIFSENSDAENNQPLEHFIYPLPPHILSKKEAEAALRHTDVAQPAIGAVSMAMTRILKRFGIFPDITCGHSFGELSALCAAGWIDEETLASLAVLRGKFMAKAGRQDKDPGSMLAVQAPVEKIERLIKQENLNLIIANKNSPSQGVLSGATDEILRARKLCRQKKVRAVQLPVAAAFHSHLVKKAAEPFSKELTKKSISPSAIDVLSNSTGSLYTKDKKEAKTILGQQLARPVDFISNIQTMAENGVTTFIEVGPKAVLTGLVKSILNDQEISLLSVDSSAGKNPGLLDLACVLSRLAVQGEAVDLTQWEDNVVLPASSKMRIPLAGANPKPTNRCTRPISTPVSQHDSGSKKTQIKPDEQQENQQNDEQQKINSPRKNQMNTTADGNKKKHTKGSDMMPQDRKKSVSTPSIEAMKMVQKGLEAMQQLQAQTAQTHEKFLETQAQASQALANILNQTNNMMGRSSEPATPAMPSYVAEPVISPAAPVPPVEPVPSLSQDQSVIVSETTTEFLPASDGDQRTVPDPQPDHYNEPDPDPSPPVSMPLPDESSAQTQQILFDIVSNLTGFPVEMLEPEMNIESDLGIDSIKKVEIISELEKQIPSCEGLTTETIGSVQTLKDICETIQTAHDKEKLSQKPAGSASCLNDASEKKPARTARQTDSQAISSVLFDTISELTGFPVEMLEPSMNLESDLGIDSIKRVEILSRLEQALESIQTISSEDIANLKTIEEITQHLAAATQGNSPEAKKKSPESDLEQQIEAVPSKTASISDDHGASEQKLRRQTVRLIEYPTNQIRFYNGAKIELPQNKKVYITNDSSGLARQIQKQFLQSDIDAQLIHVQKKTSA